jgi:hypothetical protein
MTVSLNRNRSNDVFGLSKQYQSEFRWEVTKATPPVDNHDGFVLVSITLALEVQFHL